ncbi:MAG: anthranilate synthase component I, partial [Deltaproteobacteria bacterium]|nr:anthranilate synthase component I [Deltaproteobacteria bacterium]
KPSLDDFLSLAKKGNLVPLWRELLADTETPISAYLNVRDGGFSYLLESAEKSEKIGRCSFIGYRPFLVVRFQDQQAEIRQGNRRDILKGVEDPVSVLRPLKEKYVLVTHDDLPPFQGGLVGFINYDLVRKWERLPGIGPKEKAVPEAVFVGTRRMIIFDHQTHKLRIVVFVHVEKNDDLRRCYEEAYGELEETTSQVLRPLSTMDIDDSASLSELRPNMSREEYESAVHRAKEYIAAGDAIQIVLSQEFSGDLSGDPFTLYRNLRSINPSPYMFYLDFEEVKFVGASPEVLVRSIDGRIELVPIAGTRPRGENDEEDRALEEDLISDPKERAEHIMLVDLGRNDAGKVAMPGSVKVTRLMEVERFSHVMHIVSHIEGLLRSDMDCFDLFVSAFPAGTVAGAPKIRAMEIINQLEPSQRGAYAGAVGYFGFNGNMDFCITIRTMTIVNGRLSLQVGAGIVADSSPEREYEETMKKAAAMFKAIREINTNDPRNR